MLPQFPVMKKLELSDREDIEELISRFPPYSDFNFVSLFSYDTENRVEVSTLFGNLVLKFQDYIDLEMFYTFLGTQRVDETIQQLLAQSQAEHLRSYLKLIPHDVIEHIDDPDAFFIQEDRDDFDYIIDAQAFGNLEGRTYHSKRKEMNKFVREYEGMYSFCELDLRDGKIQDEIIELFHFWIANFDKNPIESHHELVATQKLLMQLHSLRLPAFGVRINGKLVAYLIAQLLPPDYALLQFGKWNMQYRGLGEFFEKECIRTLHHRGAVSINLEQDLGIPGLRHAKELCKPIFFLKKYRVSIKETSL